jgi:hypothetical protein
MSEDLVKTERTSPNTEAYYIIDDNSGSPSANYLPNVNKEGIIVISEENNTSANKVH